MTWCLLDTCPYRYHFWIILKCAFYRNSFLIRSLRVSDLSETLLLGLVFIASWNRFTHTVAAGKQHLRPGWSPTVMDSVRRSRSKAACSRHWESWSKSFGLRLWGADVSRRGWLQPVGETSAWRSAGSNCHSSQRRYCAICEPWNWSVRPFGCDCVWTRCRPTLWRRMTQYLLQSEVCHR